jgi:hypothetical protein
MQELVTAAQPYSLVVAEEYLFYRVNRTGHAGQNDAYYRHDLTWVQEVTEQDYYQAKYGAALAPYERGEMVALLPAGGSLRCSLPDSVVRHFSPSGQLLREFPTSIEATMCIGSITLDAQGHLWTTEPAFHHVAQYELATAQKIYELGGSWEPGELRYPEEAICYGPDVFISDMGNERLLQLNTHTKALSTYRTFTQPVYEYRRLRGQEVVRLQDGLYIL